VPSGSDAVEGVTVNWTRVATGRAELLPPQATKSEIAAAVRLVKHHLLAFDNIRSPVIDI
jgi:hypothetical protein